MKKLDINYVLMFLGALTMQSCEVVGGIFKAGVWVGVIIVLVIVFIVVRLMSGGKKD